MIRQETFYYYIQTFECRNTRRTTCLATDRLAWCGYNGGTVWARLSRGICGGVGGGGGGGGGGVRED